MLRWAEVLKALGRTNEAEAAGRSAAADLLGQSPDRFCRDSVIRPTKAAGPTPIKKPASRTGSLQTSLCL